MNMEDEVTQDDTSLETGEPETFEDITYSKLHIIEDKELSEQTDGYLRGRLLGSIADEKNANDRLYPKAVWEKQISRIAELMTRGRFVGLNDHPSFFSGAKPTDIVLKFEDVWFGGVDGPAEDSNELWLETIVIPTAGGKDIAEILKAGVEIGVSSNGHGSTKPVYKIEGDEEVWDYDEVQLDYQVGGFDLVYRPSVEDARVYKLEHRVDNPMDVEEVRERYPELVNAIESAIKEPLETELAEREEELVGLRTSAETGMAIQKEQAEAIEAKEGELDSARSEMASISGELTEAKELIEHQTIELVELRPLKPKLEALNHLLEKVQGLPMAWRLVDVLKQCETPEEVDEKFDEAKDNAEALLYAEDFLGTRGGRARYGLVKTDAESDEEFEKKKEEMEQAAKRAGLS